MTAYSIRFAGPIPFELEEYLKDYDPTRSFFQVCPIDEQAGTESIPTFWPFVTYMAVVPKDKSPQPGDFVLRK